MEEKSVYKKIPKIGITLGDVNGIGIEIMMKTLNDKRIHKHITPIIYGTYHIMKFYREYLQIDFDYWKAQNLDKINPKTNNVISISNDPVTIEPGKPNPSLSKLAILSLDCASQDLLENKIDAIVTNPINKQHMASQGFEFEGHTEYFAHKSEGMENLMLMIGEHLKIGMVTGHTPLQQVVSTLTYQKIETKLNILIHALGQDFNIRKPKIAILGINPHAGDKGRLGNEEQVVLIPLIEKFTNEGHLIFGPYSADGFFGSGQYKQFDAVLSMYHDQGLVPFKTLNFGNGVNYTAGLPFIRTSPDHGTAYDLVGKNTANLSSFRAALYLAKDIWRQRHQNF